MNKIGYLRVLGIPEIDNVNRARLLKDTTRIFKDEDGSLLDLYLSLKNECKLLTVNNIINMCLAGIDLENLNGRDYYDFMLPMLATHKFIVNKLIEE